MKERSQLAMAVSSEFMTVEEVHAVHKDTDKEYTLRRVSLNS